MDYIELKNLVKNHSRVILGTYIEDKYLTDGLGIQHGEADALIFVKNTQEVIDIIKFANKNKIPVTPRGAGTCLTGGTIPTERGIVLDLSKMNNILELDEENLNITLEPGVLLKDLQAYVESKNLFYPPDPGEKSSTIGGNISTNAGGMRAVKYGVTKDYVKELEIVSGDGTILNVGSKTIKNSSGLNLKDLIVGSEGTLGIITKITLRVIPKPAKSVSVLIPFNNLETGVNCISKIIKSNSNPTAIEFMENNIVENSEKFVKLKLPCKHGNAYLLLTFDGDENEIKSNIKKTKEVVINNGAIDFKELSEKEAIDSWQIRGALASSICANNEQVPVDIVVPINKIAEFVDFTNGCGKRNDIQVIYFGHAGDGNIHVSAIRNSMEQNEWNKRTHNLLDELYTKSKELNGLVSGEHGIGLTKSNYFKKVTDKENIAYMQSIKGIFDKNNILNVNKVYY